MALNPNTTNQLDWSKLKQITDDILKCIQNEKYVPYRVENCYKQFLLFSLCLSQLYIFVRQNAALCGNGLKWMKCGTIWGCLALLYCSMKQIFQMPCVHCRGHIFDAGFMKIGLHVCLWDIKLKEILIDVLIDFDKTYRLAVLKPCELTLYQATNLRLIQTERVSTVGKWEIARC